MNTLPRAVTARWFESEDAFWTLRRHWRNLLGSERKYTLSATHHLLYQALLGRDWRRGFTPPRNPRKLVNGAFASWALFGALARIHWRHNETDLLAAFDGLVTAEMLATLRSVLPLPRLEGYSPEQFAPASWPFEAYPLPTTVPAAHD